ncbi:MAG: hypothetical protein M0R75_06945 [Dehalococcoidia bacterium]|nr:hypothetical protein [Dehalococcoidia bacterium]
MNTETLEVAPEPVKPAAAKRFNLREVPREAVEAAYLEVHNGVGRAARRHMARDFAKGRVAREVIELLQRQAEA